MPKIIEKYKILVASPSDVRDERESISEVVEELNNTYGGRTNIIIELIKWETHSAPAISESGIQAIIDKDFGNDYDLFIGILWKKFGTPTMNYGSGTEQEFRNARLKFINDPNSIQILFYFKTATPLSLGDIDPLELIKVNEFKLDIGSKGVYSFDFNTIEELQKFLRIHIPKRLDDLRKSTSKGSSEIVMIEKQQNEISLEEDLGIIDYQEIIEDSFEDSNQALSRITDATIKIGKDFTEKTLEIDSLKLKKQAIGKKFLRDLCKRTASFMNDYASRIEPDILIYSNNFEKGVNAYSKLITISSLDFNGTNHYDKKSAIASLENLLLKTEYALDQTKSFLITVSNFPRISRDLNVARRNVESKVETFINKMEVCCSITNEIIKNLLKA